MWLYFGAQFRIKKGEKNNGSMMTRYRTRQFGFGARLVVNKAQQSNPTSKMHFYEGEDVGLEVENDARNSQLTQEVANPAQNGNNRTGER